MHETTNPALVSVLKGAMNPITNRYCYLSGVWLRPIWMDEFLMLPLLSLKNDMWSLVP